jgi:F0F1-type ATP synthase membrane subunit c/vacuolar-type H+-ATPase subunit K
VDRNLSILLVFALALILPCWVFAACGKSSISALGRNPSAAPKILQTMIIVLVFAEAAALLVILVAFQLFD